MVRLEDNSMPNLKENLEVLPNYDDVHAFPEEGKEQISKADCAHIPHQEGSFEAGQGGMLDQTHDEVFDENLDSITKSSSVGLAHYLMVMILLLRKPYRL